MSGWRHAISWFPGHVAKASREMTERLCRVDMVIEVRDARAPRSTSSSMIDRMLHAAHRSHRRIIVVNKADLVSQAHRDHIARWMEKDNPGVPWFFTTATSERSGVRDARGVTEVLGKAVERLHELSPRLFTTPDGDLLLMPEACGVAEAAATHTGLGQQSASRMLPLIMMVTGVPNVGKSSLINAFRYISARGAPDRRRHRSRKPAVTGVMPGVTTSMSGFQVSLAVKASL